MGSTELFYNKTQPCGCFSVPEGVHIAGCSQAKVGLAPRCERCGFRGAGEDRCPFCGEER